MRRRDVRRGIAPFCASRWCKIVSMSTEAIFEREDGVTHEWIVGEATPAFDALSRFEASPLALRFRARHVRAFHDPSALALKLVVVSGASFAFRLRAPVNLRLRFRAARVRRLVLRILLGEDKVRRCIELVLLEKRLSNVSFGNQGKVEK